MPQTITPYLLYEDAGEALSFLSGAFGFEETRRNTSSDGQVSHAEMRFRGGEIHLGQPPRPSSPRSYGGTTVLLYVYVDNVDEHCAQARAAGAEIVDEPADQDYGERRYHCRDLEGHSWYFAQIASWVTRRWSPGRGASRGRAHQGVLDAKAP